MTNKKYVVVETDNYGRDYPDEKLVPAPPMDRNSAEELADWINTRNYNQERYFKVVSEGYQLQPGFEP